MKVKLKIINDEKIYRKIEELKQEIKKLDIEKIDNIKQNLMELHYDLTIDEEDLPNGFNDYIITTKHMQEVYTKNKQLEALIQKSINNKKDILVIWDESHE